MLTLVEITRAKTGPNCKKVLIACLKCNKLNPVMRSKCQRLVSKGVLLWHDKSWTHCCLNYGSPPPQNCELLEHPTYSPDLAPSDYHLFVQKCF